MTVIGFFPGEYSAIAKAAAITSVYLEAGCDLIALRFPADCFWRENDPSECGDFSQFMDSCLNLKMEFPHAQFTLEVQEMSVKEIGADQFVDFCEQGSIKRIMYRTPVDSYTSIYLESRGLRLFYSLTYPVRNGDQSKIGRGIDILLKGSLPKHPEQALSLLQTTISDIRKFIPENPIYCDMFPTTLAQCRIVELAGADGICIRPDCAQSEPHALEAALSLIRSLKSGSMCGSASNIAQAL